MSEKINNSGHVDVPEKYFKYAGAAVKDGHSLYQCMICPKGCQQKPLSCY